MNKMHLKKKNSKFLLFILVLFVLSITFSFKFLSKNINRINTKEYLDLFTNICFKHDNKLNKILDKIFNSYNKVTNNELVSYKIEDNIKTNSHKLEDNYNSSDYEKITSHLKINTTVDDPIVYIYNTHQLETYYSSDKMHPNVMMAAFLLGEKLNKMGISTLVEDTNMDEFIKTMNLPSDELYGASRAFINQARSKYPNLKFFIDIHRDSISKDISTINIDGKNYARVLFVLGMNNPNCEENRMVFEDINNRLSKYYKLSRGIYEISLDYEWNEAYNQDISKNAMLIELGGVDNTMEEVLNTIDILSKELGDYINENK